MTGVSPAADCGPHQTAEPWSNQKRRSLSKVSNWHFRALTKDFTTIGHRYETRLCRRCTPLSVCWALQLTLAPPSTFLRVLKDAARGQRRGADQHSPCAAVNPVVAPAPSDPIMSVAIKGDGLSYRRCYLGTLVRRPSGWHVHKISSKVAPPCRANSRTRIIDALRSTRT